MNPRNLQIIGFIVIIISIIIFWIPPLSNLFSGAPVTTIDVLSMILGIFVDAPSFISMIAPEKTLSKFGKFPPTTIDPMLSELSEVVSNIERLWKELRLLKLSKTDTFFARSTVMDREIDSAIGKLQLYKEELDEIKKRLNIQLRFYGNIPSRGVENDSAE